MHSKPFVCRFLGLGKFKAHTCWPSGVTMEDDAGELNFTPEGGDLDFDDGASVAART